MGIQSLTTFVQENSELFTEKFVLQNTDVVIDGFALLRMFLVHSKKEQFNAQFGGNYVYYGELIAKFFEKLKINNVQPYVILEGTEKYQEGEEEIEQRNLIRVKRLRTLAKLSKEYSEWENTGGRDMYPNLFSQVFKDVLKERKVPCIRTLYNSDNTIAQVANQLQCPVLSADSNNYIFDLPAGFINTYNWSTEYDADEELNQEPIQCRIYRRSKLLQLFELKPEVLPLFAVVVGNNYRKRHWVAKFAEEDKIYSAIQRIRVDKKPPGIKVTSGKGEIFPLENIVTFLSWLRRKSRRLALELFTQVINNQAAERKLRVSLDMTVDNCELRNALGCALNHLQGGRCTFSHDQTFHDCNGNKQIIPEDFAVRFINENWIKEMIQIRMLNQIWAQIEVDDYDKESSLIHLKDILAVLAAISMDGLTDYNAVKILDWKKMNNEIHLWKHDLIIDPCEVEKYRLAKQSSMEDKKRTLLAVLQASVEDYEKSVTNLAKIYNLAEDETRQLALMEQIMRYMSKILPEECPENFKIFKLSVTTSVAYHMGVREQSVNAFQLRPNIRSDYRRQVIYLLNILQRIIRIFGQINLVFGNPMPKIEPHKYLNCVHVAKLYHNSQLKNDPILSKL